LRVSSRRGFVKRRGTTWTAYWKVDTAKGLRQRTKGGFLTRKKAETFLNETIARLQDGGFVDPSKVTVAEFLVDSWLPSRATSLRPTTFDAYTRIVDRHVVPRLGHVRLQQLSPHDLDRFYADVLNAGLAPKSVRNMHTMLHKALRDAMRKNLVVRNVADAADPPRLARPGENEMKTWSPEHLRVFLNEISKHRLGAAYILAATTGMRRGEVIGLRWRDVDLSARRLVIAHTITAVGYKLVEGAPKTNRGRRTIALDVETARLLTEHRDRQRAEKDAVGIGYRDRGLVFAREDGSPVHPDYFSQTFDRTVARLGLPRIRLHDLRHTHATLGLAAGVPVKVMSSRLGHATSAFTQDVYMHAIPELEEAAAEQIAGLVFGLASDEEAEDG